MTFESEFYSNQARLGEKASVGDITRLCRLEAKRLTSRLRRELNELRASENSVVLDAPCGYGNMLYTYSLMGIECKGIDLDATQVALAVEIGLDACVQDVFNIDPTSSFTAISSMDFLEHLSKDDALRVLRLFHRLLQTDGMLIIRTPCGDSPFGIRDFSDDLTHKWMGTSQSVSAMLDMAGFKDIKVVEDWPLPKKLTYTRIIIGLITRAITRWYLMCVGFGSPRCLSPSMILVGRKKNAV